MQTLHYTDETAKEREEGQSTLLQRAVTFRDGDDRLEIHWYAGGTGDLAYIRPIVCGSYYGANGSWHGMNNLVDHTGPKQRVTWLWSNDNQVRRAAHWFMAEHRKMLADFVVEEMETAEEIRLEELAAYQLKLRTARLREERRGPLKGGTGNTGPLFSMPKAA